MIASDFELDAAAANEEHGSYRSLSMQAQIT